MLLLITVVLMPCCLCENILVMFPLPAYSHFKPYQPIFRELARRGHNLTVVSPFPMDKPIQNYNDIVVSYDFKKDIDKFDFKDLREIDRGFTGLVKFRNYCPMLIDLVARIPEIENIIYHDNSHFDLLILEPFYCQEPLLALSHKYQAPVIAIHPVVMNLILARYTGNTIPLSSVPHLRLPTDGRMTTFQKATSSFYFIIEYLYFHWRYKPIAEKYMRDNYKYPGADNMPGLDDLLSNISLVLIDNHVALSTPQPLLPNVVEFGGLSLQDTPPLPQELESYMNDSKDGVVFFSWGSIVPSKSMNPQVLSNFLSVFSKLKQRVLFKWENETLEGKPDNVRIGSWFPQASILAHPNLKVFISHCGIHGVTESVHNGVPILATPLRGDQYQNAKRAENAGYAIVLDIDSFSQQELEDSLNKLLYEPSYKKAAERQRKILNDRPLPVLDNTVYWIEYVMRHQGAHHLRPLGADSTWSYLLDVFSPFIVIFILAVYLLRCVIKRIPIRRRRPTTKTHSKLE